MLKRSLTVCALLLVVAAGCDSPQRRQTLDQEGSNLRWLTKLHTQMLSRSGKPPQDEAEFKKFIQGMDSATLERVLASTQATSVDELFVSERDGQPYVIFYEKRPDGVSPDLMGYEQTGVNGKRYVGYGLGVIEEVDEARFAELVPEGSRPKN